MNIYMANRSNSTNLRIMINKDWVSNWFSEQNQYTNLLQNDFIVYKYFFWRLFLRKRLLTMRVIRFSKKAIFFFLISFPRKKEQKRKLILTRSNTFILKMEKILFIFFKTKEYKKSSFRIARRIGKLLENKVKFRSKIIKRFLDEINTVKNLLVICKGRINGVEMAKKDSLLKGFIPFRKFSINMNFSIVVANTKKGLISIRVWSHTNLT